MANAQKKGGITANQATEQNTRIYVWYTYKTFPLVGKLR